MDNRWTIKHSEQLNDYQVYSEKLKGGAFLSVFNAFSIGNKVILNLLFEDDNYVYPVLFAELNTFEGRLTIPSNALALITEDVTDTLRIQLLHNERKLGQHSTLFFTKKNSFFARLLQGIHNPQRTPYLGLADIRSQKRSYLLYKQIAESLKTKVLNILDLGCGSGYGGALLARAGFKVTAIDMDNLPITYAKRLYTGNTITFACQGIEEVLQKEEKFDAVVACEVLEHNDDYASFLEMLTAVTRTEGEVALSVPSWVYHGIDLNSDHRTNWTFTKLDKVLKHYFRLHDKYIINFAIDPQQYSIEATETNPPDAENFLFIGKKVTGPAGFNPHPSSVLLVCHNIPPYEYTGTPIITRRYARGLQRLGYRVAVLTPNLPVNDSRGKVVLEESEGIPLYRVNPVDFVRTSLEAIFNTDRLKLQPYAQVFNHFSPDIVHIIDYVFMPPQMLQLAADYGAAIIRHVWNTEEICLQVSPVISRTRKICAGPDNARACARCILSPALADNDIFTARQVSQLAGQISGWHEYMHYLYSKVVDAVIFSSVSFGDYFLKYLPVPEKKTYHVPHGFLSPAFPKRRPRDKERVTFGFLGEFVFRKGIDLLVKAFQDLPKNKVELLVYGKVHDQVLFNELKDVRCARYMGEFTPEDVDSILQNIDVGLVPSHFETYSMVLREFLSYNIPVIATRFFGSEIIQDGENGLLVEIGNAEELKQKVLAILNDKDLLVKLQAGAYATKIPSIYEEIDAVYHIYQETYERKFGVRGEVTGASRNNVEQFTSIIMPVYNNWEYTRQCLLTLEAEGYRQQAEVIVVDNASTDATATGLKSEFPWVEVIHNKQNLGFAKACNRGAETARGKYLVFLNNDIKVQKSWLEDLIAACEGEAGAGIVGSKLLYPDGRLQHAGMEIAYPGAASPIHAGHLRYDQPDAPDVRREVDAVTGAAMLVPRAVFYELGGFEEVYQNGYEDVDLCLKARARGYRILYEPASRAIHYESKTPGRFANEIKNINTLHHRWLPYVLQHFRKASCLQETQPSNRPPVSIIIVAYNSLATIAACLESVLATTTEADEIIVVDNNSSDETFYYVECLQKVLPAGRVQLHCETGNMGYARAAARGAAIASREILVFLNPDTVVFPGWLEGLAQPLTQSEGRIAASGPVSNYAAGRQNVIHYAERDYLQKEAAAANIARTLGEQQRGKVIPTDLLTGFCLAVKRTIYAEVGGIDADLFLVNDLDFSWRLGRAGYGQVVLPAVFVYRQLAIQSLGQDEASGLAVPIAAVVQKKKVSIIIPVFNKVELTKKCLETLFRNTVEGQYEVIIIDNASTDGTKEYLASLHTPGIKIITNEHNLGFAKACNQGACASKGDYLMFLNNDTEPRKGWLDPLIQILDNDPAVAAAGSKLLFPDGTVQHAGVAIIEDRKLPDPLVARHIFYRQSADRAETNELRTYQALTAACILVRKDCYKKVGGFDENYWNGYEDVDLCFKLQEHGWRLVYQPESVVIHHESQSGPERFKKVAHNIRLLHERWIGKIKPDVIIHEDGSITNTDARKIRQYIAPAGIKPANASVEPVTATRMISIIILTFNQLEYTKKCLQSIEEFSFLPYELIIVDNGSTDGTKGFLEEYAKKHDKCKIILNKENRGFGGGNNQGIEKALGDYILFLNNDVVVTEKWLERLVEHIEKSPDIGMVGPMSNYVSGPQLVENTPYGKDMKAMQSFARNFYEENRGKSSETIRLVGFCLLVKKEVIDMIGGFDEGYKIGNSEDNDLCLRACIAGFRNIIAHDVFIHHYGSMTFKGNSIDYQATMERNRTYFAEKWKDIVEVNGNAYRVCMTKEYQVKKLIEWGEERYAQRDVHAAIKLFERVLKLDRNNPQALNNLGVLQWQLGAEPSAMRIFQTALKFDPKDVDALENLVQAATETGRFDLIDSDLLDTLKDAQPTNPDLAILINKKRG